MNRRPLMPLNPELAAKIRQGIGPRGVDENNIPLGSSDEEKRAAANPGLPAQKESTMDDVKGGIKTSEFWLKMLAAVAMAVLGYFSAQGLDTLAAALPQLGWVGGLLALAAVAAKPAVAWALHKLSETYADNRTEVKVAALGSGRPSEAVVNAR